MPAILAVESGGALFSAALSSGGEIRQLSALARAHSEVALPLVSRLLQESNLQLSDCAAFAFGAGPGKFSGLRLSCAVAQSFAYSFNRPAVAVDSLAALAHANYDLQCKSNTEFELPNSESSAAAENEKSIAMYRAIFLPEEGGDNKSPSRCWAAIPAHRGHVFAAHCSRARPSALWRSPRPRLMVVEHFAPGKRTVHFCGEAFSHYPELPQTLKRQTSRAVFSQTAARPSAAAICALALQMHRLGEVVSAMQCRPRYCRPQVAQTIAARQAQSSRDGVK